MDYDDRYHPAESNDYEDNEKAMNELKRMDAGYNKVFRDVSFVNKKGENVLKRQKVEFYTTGDIGSRIRDAESGVYYNAIVGSLDEHQFYKVGLASGECKSKNGSNTLFYLSPAHYEKHFFTTLKEDVPRLWEERRIYYSQSEKE